MSIDDLESLDEETRKKVEELQNVTREKNGDKVFAQRNYRLGIILMRLNHHGLALSHFDKIKVTDDKTILSQSLLHTAFIYETEGEIDKAIKYWELIKKEYGVVIYSVAQLYAGYYYSISNEIELAIKAWKTIRKDYNLNLYNQAQFNLGVAYGDKGDHNLSKDCWINIELGESINLYTSAQFNLGYDYDIEGNYEKALEIWGNITATDSPGFYAKAQYNIGKTYENIKDYKCAIQAFENVGVADDPKIYKFSQYQIGLLLIRDQVSKKYVEAKQAFSNAESAYPYEAYCYKKICDLLEISETKKLGLSLLKLFNLVLDIVNILTLDFSKYSDEEKPFERKLAHYTSTYISDLLLSNDKKNSSPSLFRLNTINNVNDPSEGQLLIRKLKCVKGNKFTALDFNEEFHAFISCFTFNHDSLNQFRLYGKQDNKEASGVSLVFNKNFFQPKNFAGGISYLSIENTSKFVKTSSSLNNEEFCDTQIQKPKNENQEIIRRSVMRCVYLDPSSDYFHLAQRNRLTFFREFGDKIVTKNGKQKSQAEYEWGIYQEYITIITDEFKTAYENLKTTYKEVETEIDNVRFILGSLKQKELNTLLDEILLPLKYLIKHSAFREEQECRMIYITSIDRPEVTMEYGSFLYVEYEPSVKDHLDKIYIAPAALHHKRYFDHTLKDVDVPVEVSGNVFR